MAKTIPNSKKLKSLHDYFFQIPGWSDNDIIPLNYGLVNHLFCRIPKHDQNIICLAFHSQSTNKFAGNITSKFYYQLGPNNINLFWLACNITYPTIYVNSDQFKMKVEKYFSVNKNVKQAIKESIPILQHSLNMFYQKWDQYLIEEQQYPNIVLG